METRKFDGPYLLMKVSDDDQGYKATRSWTIKTVHLENGKPRNYSDYAIEERELADFTISAHYWDKEYIDRSPEYRNHVVVGFGEYDYRDVFRVDTRRAQAMSKFLTKLEKSLTAQYETLGSPSSFAESVLRIAIAMKAKGFLVQVVTDQKVWSYDDCEYRHLSASAAKWLIESDMRDYIAKLYPESVAA